MKKIIVLDLETGGLNPYNPIVEIGMVLLDLETFEIEPLFHSLICEKGKRLETDAWIFENTDLEYEDVMKNGKDIEVIREQLQSLFNKYPVTAFNKKFDLSFLRARKFVFPLTMEDPMEVAKDILQIKHPRYGLKFPNVTECLDYFKIHEKEPHRADQDARLEAMIVRELIKIKKFSLEPQVNAV
jgi:DNA polymerase III epsilon subunit-like protein